MEAGEQRKDGRPGNTYHMNEIRWTQGGHRGGGAQLQVHTATNTTWLK